LSRRPELVEEELKDRSGKTHMSEINLTVAPDSVPGDIESTVGFRPLPNPSYIGTLLSRSLKSSLFELHTIICTTEHFQGNIFRWILLIQQNLMLILWAKTEFTFFK